MDGGQTKDFFVNYGVLHAYTGPGGTAAVPDGVIKIVSGAFSWNDTVREVVVPEGVTEIEYGAFQGCGGLEKVTLPASVTKIGRGTFAECPKLRCMEISPENPRYACADGLMISNDGKSRTLELALRGLTGPVRIPEGVRKIARYAFDGCQNVTEIFVPDSVTSIEAHGFSNCPALKKLRLPPKVKKISRVLCAGCGRLEEVVFPEELTGIGERAFLNCGLREIVLPGKVQEVEASAFSGCPLEKVTVSSPGIRFSTTAFGERLEQITLVRNHVPLDSLQKSVQDVILHAFARRYQAGEEMDPDERGECLAFIRSHRKSLWKDRELLPILMREQYITAREYERCLEKVQQLGDLELSAALLEYRNRNIPQEELDQLAERKFQI